MKIKPGDIIAKYNSLEIDYKTVHKIGIRTIESAKSAGYRFVSPEQRVKIEEIQLQIQVLKVELKNYFEQLEVIE